MFDFVHRRLHGEYVETLGRALLTVHHDKAECTDGNFIAKMFGCG
jgi:hypothetical protein